MINAPKGTNDMLPADSYKWRAVEDAAHAVAKLYNAKQIRTPVFESADLYLRSIGDSTDIVNKEMYIFEDKGGRRMALRPEGTAGAMRAFIEHNLGESLPLKTYYIESLYRYEQPQAGRYREHFQFGAEFFGSSRPEFDVELICMARDFLNKLGFKDLTLKINSIGCPECRKQYNAALREFLKQHHNEICGDCKRRSEVNPLRALDCKIPSCKELYKSAPKISDYLCDECRTHNESVLSGLDANNVKYVFDGNLVRGLDYYTRTVFEFEYGSLAVMGGGRYDGMCEQLGGKPTPCVGFGSGIERLIAAAEKSGIEFEMPRPTVFVAAQCDAARTECRVLVGELRKKSVSAECDLMGKSLKAQFKYADKQKFKYVITIGESELTGDTYIVKNMDDGSTETVLKNDISDKISGLVLRSIL